MSIRCLSYRLAAVLALLGFFSGSAAAQQKLSSYQADVSQSSVSGLSSGAFMASQFHVAFSSTMVGAGIIAGGPFYCAGAFPFTSFLINALTICETPLPGLEPNPATLLSSAKIFAQAGRIDDLTNMKKQKVYLFSGKNDHTVTTAVVTQAAAFYKLAGVAMKNMHFVHNSPAGHAILTNNQQDAACATTATPYINNCKFNLSQVILPYIYGKLNAPAVRLSGHIIAFDQREFITSSLASMSETAYLYVPDSCISQSCKVHVVFHGCEQSVADIGDKFFTTTGYNELADSNNILVLYPQVQASALIPYNPKGCWDFWGYSSSNPFEPDFYSKQGPQMAAVKAMLDRLGQARQ